MAEITILRGETRNIVQQWVDQIRRPIDITGWTAEIDIREKPEFQTPIAQYSSPSNGITVDGASGTITLALSSTETEAMSFTNAVLDVRLKSPSGEIVYFPSRTITAKRTVTRDDS